MIKIYKVIIAGSRDFNDYDLLVSNMAHFLHGYKPSEVEIVSGTARGADRLGENFANKHHCKLTKMPADWDKFGNSAGYRRNADMAIYADACVIFWDGVSKGTKHMIDLAEKYNLDLKVIKYNEYLS